MSEVQCCRGFIQNDNAGLLAYGQGYENPLPLSGAQLIEPSPGQMLHIGKRHGALGQFQIFSFFDGKQTQVRRTSHKHHFRYRKGYVGGRRLRHYGDIAGQFFS